MLKLEKASRDGLISIIVREKDKLFTQPFTLALGIAIAIHLGLVILFHVVPFKIGMSENVFPPTRVHADTALKDSAIAQITPVIQSIRGLPSLPVSTPAMISQPKFLTYRPVEFNKAANSKAQSFVRIEREIYQPEFNPLDNRPIKAFEIVITGVLAEHGLVSDGLGERPIPLFPSIKKDSMRVIYSVQVEGKTGKIFWHELKQAADPSIDKFAEAVLQDMKFTIDPGVIAMGGEIEMHFNQEIQ